MLLRSFCSLFLSQAGLVWRIEIIVSYFLLSTLKRHFGNLRLDRIMQVGDKVKDFTLLDQYGKPFTLSENLDGGYLVLFFYPAAMTKGCTAESCHFRDLGAEFKEVGAKRVGISADPVAKQLQFSNTNSFDYPLLADIDGRVASDFGVKRRFGPIPVKRHTFVISPSMEVELILASELNMGLHADKSLAYLRSKVAK